MINQSELQLCYNDLYVELRRYIWGYRVVEAIADLEISVYKAFSDIQEVKSNYEYLYSLIRNIVQDDEDLQKVCDAFSDIISEDSDTYNKIYKVNEVINDEDIKDKKEHKGRRVEINTD